MKITHFIPMLAGLLLAACQAAPSPDESSPPASAASLSGLLPGSWEPTTLHIRLHTAYGIPDSSVLISLQQEGDARPARMRYHFLAGQRFRIDFLDERGTRTDSTRGLYNLFGDTLMLIEPDATYQFTVRRLTAQTFEMRGMLDGDADGQEDDHYFSRWAKRTDASQPN